MEVTAKLSLESAVGYLKEIDWFAYEDHGEDAWMYGYVAPKMELFYFYLFTVSMVAVIKKQKVNG